MGSGAFTGKPRDELQKGIEKLQFTKPLVPQRIWRKPLWVKPELQVKVRHLAGGDTLRGLVTEHQRW